MFRLGGVYRECSLREFAWRMGLYTEVETQSPFFIPFLLGCVRDFTPGTLDVQFWRGISNHEYNTRDSSESQIRNPVFRFLHRLITFSINHKHHGDKVPIQNLFYLWTLITPGVCCDLPYMLARFMGKKAANSRPGSPITGGHLVTRLARSYQILTHDFVRNLTRFPDTDLTIQVLGVMRAVVNIGGRFVIPPIDDEQEEVQPGQQPPARPRRRNVRARGEVERERAASQYVQGVPTDPFQSRVGTYLDNLRGHAIYHTQLTEGIYSHLGVTRPPSMPPQYPYFPTWEELWRPQDDGAGPSGAQDHDDD